MPWLSDGTLARGSVIVVAVWAGAGWHAVLYLAYLQSIPGSTTRSRRSTARPPLQQFRHITLPLLTPAIVISQFLLMTDGLKVFDLPYTLTRGGPGFATQTITQSIITSGVGQGEYGLASALAVVFTVAVAVFDRPVAASRRIGTEGPVTASAARPAPQRVMIALAGLVGLPLYYIVVNTFKTQAEMTTSPLGLPPAATSATTRRSSPGSRCPRASPTRSTSRSLGVLFQLAVGAMAGYGIIMRDARVQPGRSASGLLLAFVVPTQATLIPLYRTLVQVDLVDSLNGLIIMYPAARSSPSSSSTATCARMPFDIIEAARIDGAGVVQIFWRIVLPLIRPILVTVGVFQTMWVWNDFITPNVFISSPEKRTIVLQVYSAVGEFTTDWPAFMTVSVLALIPMVIFFMFTQRHIVSGLLAGGIKG